MFVFRFRNIVDKNRQFIVKFEIKFSINSKSQQQFVRFDFEIIKNEIFFVMIVELFNVTINDSMRLVREIVDIKIIRHFERQTKLLKNEFIDMLKKHFIDTTKMLRFEINKIVTTVFVNAFINVFIIIEFNTSVSFTSFIDSKFSKFEKVKYFDLDYKQKKSYITVKSLVYNFVVNVNKHIYYIEIYAFVNKLKNFQYQHQYIEIVVNFRNFVFV